MQMKKTRTKWIEWATNWQLKKRSGKFCTDFFFYFKIEDGKNVNLSCRLSLKIINNEITQLSPIQFSRRYFLCDVFPSAFLCVIVIAIGWLMKWNVAFDWSLPQVFRFCFNSMTIFYGLSKRIFQFDEIIMFD